ncbi:hypothetical protein Sru01_26570 [Sphaerisporangium rufum]|uniref:GPP34 family phosphoprotein n=1 Tax=Sphaerisporangium rufum TaxID=1381558 RepID=A0A919R5P3_9ACTN|nr:GPP34 family phosphoprotein [Sphaerisporangium rufum]GII77675.1 hypothetical protein Sru01_26570 [Sphaerisporangium rufum]
MEMTIAEELVLLAYREDTGRPLIGSGELDAALGGAMLAELTVLRRLDLAGRKVTVLDATPTGDPELDAALARIAGDRERRPETWVAKLQSADVRKRLLARLVERRVLSERTSKVLGLFTTRSYPEADPTAERAVRERVGDVLRGAEPDARVAVLIGVLHACKLDRKVFPEADKRRVKEVVEGQWAGPAVAKAIAAANAAIMAAITAATVTSATTAGN